MRIAVIAAAGRTGSLLVAELPAQRVRAVSGTPTIE